MSYVRYLKIVFINPHKILCEVLPFKKYTPRAYWKLKAFKYLCSNTIFLGGGENLSVLIMSYIKGSRNLTDYILIYIDLNP